MENDPLRRDILDRRYADSVRRLEAGDDDASGMGAFSPDLMARVLRNRGRLRARLESAAWRSDSARDMARRTERFLNLRAQYGSLTREERGELTALYERLLSETREVASGRAEDLLAGLEAVTAAHLKRLVAFVEGSGEGLVLGPGIRGEFTSVCATYRPALQAAVLGVDSRGLLQPVLDVGAGEGGALVAWLRERGVEAQGIDRLAEDVPHVVAADWLEYEPGQDRWGAILSHMAFSNHFLHHHRQGTPVAYRYAARYMKLLAALRPRGRFHYAPALPFMEALLPPDVYTVRRLPVPSGVVGDSAIAHAAMVTRLH